MKHLTLAKSSLQNPINPTASFFSLFFVMNEMSFSKSHLPFRTKLQLPNNLYRSASPHHYFWASIYIILLLSCNSHTSGDYLTLLCNFQVWWTAHTNGHCVLHSKFFVLVHFKNYTFFPLSRACLPYCFKGQLTRRGGGRTHHCLFSPIHIMGD